MKKIFLLLSAVLLVTFYACNSGKSESSSEIILPQGWEVLDLTAPQSSFGLPFVINIPGAEISKGVAQVMESNNGGTQVNAGANYNIEILPANGDINQKKAEIANDGIFKVSYLVDEPNLILYTAEIEGADVKQYHFLALVKIGNVTYEVSDIKDQDFSEENIKMMIESAKSLREKPKA